MNHITPVALAGKSAPRSAAAAITATICSAAIPSATERFENTSSERRIGAASSSRRAPSWRSMITPSPANIMFSGTRSPTVPTATNET